MLKINEERLLDDLDTLGQIGATGDGGVSRPAMSPADAQGREWFRKRIRSDDLELRSDGAGNLSAILPSENPAAPTLIIGSHLDSVPNGGRFDGALGTLAGLEVLRMLRDAGETLPFHLEAISFTDEEGSIFGLLGSSALTGQLTPEDLARPRGGRERFIEGIKRIGVTEESILAARRDPDSVMGYLEVHIEQGTRLESAGVDIGVVTSIVGIRSFWLNLYGEAAHAGTMPMNQRKDAFRGASAFAQQAGQRVMSEFSPGVMNCGQALVFPGAFNIVPGEVRLALEFRHGSNAQLDEMETALLELAQDIAAQHHLKLETQLVDRIEPAPMDEQLIQVIEQAADRLELSHTRLVSLAGHDAQNMSAIAPSALFFVPSVNGISHNPAEYTQPHDCVNAANVLLHAVLELKKRSSH